MIAEGIVTFADHAARRPADMFTVGDDVDGNHFCLDK